MVCWPCWGTVSRFPHLNSLQQSWENSLTLKKSVITQPFLHSARRGSALWSCQPCHSFHSAVHFLWSACPPGKGRCQVVFITDPQGKHKASLISSEGTMGAHPKTSLCLEMMTFTHCYAYASKDKSWAATYFILTKGFSSDSRKEWGSTTQWATGGWSNSAGPARTQRCSCTKTKTKEALFASWFWTLFHNHYSPHFHQCSLVFIISMLANHSIHRIQTHLN